MSKVQDITNRALRLLSVIDPTETVDAQQSENAIFAMNAMCRRWEANGMAMGWNDVANPSDDIPSPPESEECLAYNLAVRLAPEYGIQPSAAIVALAAGSLKTMQRDRMQEMPLRQTLDVPDSFSGGRYNTITDQWNQ